MVAWQRNALPDLLTDELSSQAALPPNAPPPPLLGSGFGILPLLENSALGLFLRMVILSLYGVGGARKLKLGYGRPL